MAICIPPQGGTTTGEEEVTLYADWPSDLAGKPIGTALKCTAIPNPGWAFSRWEWDVETWDDSNKGDTFGDHLYSVAFNSNESLPAIRYGFANWDAVVSDTSDGYRIYRHRRSRNLRAIFSSTGDDGGGSPGGGGSSGGSAKYYAAVNLSVRGEAARNAGCKVSVSGEPFALDSQSCVVLGSPGEVAFTLAYKESAQFKFSEYQDENGNTVTSPVILTASTSGAIANVYAIFGNGRQILHGASNTILHGRNKTILHLE